MSAITTITRTDLIDRAGASLSATPRPFVKWAGSKRGLLAQLIPHLPDSFSHYYEPFLGAGSMFFLLKPERASLNDSCRELVETYTAVRDQAERVADAAQALDVSKDTYYQVRENRSDDRVVRAGEFLYLNRTCFNGLYRVNSSGKFNVPWGAPKTDFVVDRSNLLACSEALQQPGVRLSIGDFEDTLTMGTEGDLVFLDPPYVTRHNNNGFIDYNERLFSWEDQKRLARRAEELRRVGAHVIVTNAYHSDVLALYPNFQVHELTRNSTLASSAARRGRVSEAILVGRL